MNTKITKARIKRFLAYYAPHKLIFTVDLFFASLSAVTVLLFPLVSGYITGEVLQGFTAETVPALTKAGMILLLLTLIKICSNVLYAWFGHAMGAKMEQTMRQELFAHYESLSFDFHARNGVGKLMTVISNDLTDMTELFHHAPEDLLMTIIKFIGSFVILLQINIPLTLILFAALPVLFLAAFIFDKKMEKALLQNRDDLGNMNEQLEDTLTGIRTVKAYGNERDAAKDFWKKNMRYTKSKCRFYKLEALFYETFSSYPQILTMLTVVFGAFFLSKGNMDISVLVTFLLYVATLAEPMNTALNFMRLFENGKAAFLRFMNMMETQPEIQEAASPVEVPDTIEELRFSGVSFSYPDSTETVLENVNFTVRKNETAAFAGPSGIGKTTISMLAARFYDPTKGEVLLNGIPLSAFSMESLRKSIGIVQQEVHIFNGTIEDNIAIGRPGASQAEIEDAAKKAGIHSFIASLPQGYQTLVGTRGIKLSGGQRQRISIARLFLKDPKLLILDEATSALDYESEAAVQSALEDLLKNRTGIVIAHRLSTIQNADTIYVLDHKTIAEKGTHASLLQENGIYANLYQLGTHNTLS